MAEGTRLFLKATLLHHSVLYIRPEGRIVNKWRSGWEVSCDIMSAMRAMALRICSVRLGVESPITVVAILDFFHFLTLRILKKHVEQ